MDKATPNMVNLIFFLKVELHKIAYPKTIVTNFQCILTIKLITKLFLSKQWPNTCSPYPYVTVSPSSPLGDLSVPGGSLKPPALVRLTCDAVRACGTGDVICKRWLLGPWCKPHHRTSGRCRTSRNDVAWHHLLALPPLNTRPNL